LINNNAFRAYLYGCEQVSIQPKGMKDGDPIKSKWFDEQRLNAESKVEVGGPQVHPTETNYPKGLND